MDSPEQDVQKTRDRRTTVLLAGGAVSLLLPLVGVVYLRMNEAKATRPPDSSVMFDRRESGDAKVSVTQTVTINAPPPAAGASSLPVPGGQTAVAGGGSSLDFVKGGANSAYFQEKTAAPPPPAMNAPTPPPASASDTAPPEPPRSAAKKEKKPFMMPKLQGTKTISTFKGTTPKQGAGQGMGGTGGAPADPQAGAGGGGMGGMADMFKSVPGGANNPEVQKYLKAQGK